VYCNKPVNIIKTWRKIKKIIKVSISLAKINFILRTEGSYLGIFWYLLNPLIMFLIIISIKKYALSNIQVENYPLYLFMGITGFNFFKQALSNAITSIRSNTDYIKSINTLEPEVLVVSGVFQVVFSHLFEFILIIGFMIYYKIFLAGLLFYPLIFFFFLILTLGLSFIFATIGMYIYDFDNVWIILTQLLFFISPIFYVIKKGDFIYYFNLINPLFYFLTLARSAVINFTTAPLWIILGMFFFSFSSLIIGLLVFNRFKNKFTELI